MKLFAVRTDWIVTQQPYNHTWTDDDESKHKIFRAVFSFWLLSSSEAPVLVQSPKLSNFEPGQYLDE